MVVRLILYNIEEKNVSLLESNQKLEKLISSTNQLISIHEMRIQKKNSNAEYVRRIFRIAISLYNSYDLASCYIKVDNKPLFIDSQGYNIEMINSLDFSNDFHWALQKPEHIVTPENDLEKRLGNHYKEYNETVPELKESIRFGIYIDDENCGGMSFDIKKNSNKSFKKNDFENFKSFQKLMNSFYEINYLNTKNINLKNDMVLSLIKTLELYDHYTGGHSQEVAILSKKIAIKMGLSEQTIYDIYWAGIVHDIGKIGISYDILNSTERLTPEQYEQVKMHPVYGSKILYQSEDLFSIAEIVKHHHEWWNGNGYPDKLKGNEIPFGAQVLCVADAVSAMHGKRSYASTKSPEEIIQELKAFSGKQFNTEIAKVMIELIEEGALETLKDEMI
jgi:HD-GYP domain-containing protein (c-di-GMP phosphodiesterase class II)